MRSPHIHLIALGQIALMAGCAQMEWHKANADHGTTDQDLEYCRQLARLKLAGDFPRNSNMIPKTEINPSGLISFSTQSQGQSDRLVQEQSFANSCMKQKGYQLVPAKPGGQG